MNNLMKQALKFLAVSGTGWLMDFALFNVLAYATPLPVMVCNIISALPALTFVFIVSTRKIFKSHSGRVPLWGKYALWVVWQMLLLVCASAAAQWLFSTVSASSLMAIPLVEAFLKPLCKIAVTPFTMAANFVVMKQLSERL